MSSQSTERLRARRRAEGLCVRCSQPQRPERVGKLLCVDCHQRYHGHKAGARANKTKLVPTHPCRCLRCDQTFLSPDKRLFRICQTCKVGNDILADSYTEEALRA